MDKILVIKHGALGDFVLATGPFSAIRHHHKSSKITLLTTAPFEWLAGHSGYFDSIWIDPKPPWHRCRHWISFRRRLQREQFTRVYDLQTSGRSNLYFLLFPQPKPEWSGTAAGCSHPHTNAKRNDMHTLERQIEQLNICLLYTSDAADE